MVSMATLKELREQAGLSLAELSRLANVDYRTARRADNASGTVQRVKALALLKVINQRLGTSLKVEDVDDLEVH